MHDWLGVFVRGTKDVIKQTVCRGCLTLTLHSINIPDAFLDEPRLVQRFLLDFGGVTVGSLAEGFQENF